MPFIFQYGSNCNLRRLNHATRLARDAKNPRRVQTVGKYKLAFNKRTKDNYAAADLIKSGTAGRRIWGILYEVSDRGFERLRNVVERPSYEPKDIIVEQADGEARMVKTFVVLNAQRPRLLLPKPRPKMPSACTPSNPLGGELQSWPEVFHAHLHHAHALDEPRLKNY